MKRALLIALAWIATIASPAIASTFEIHLEACCEEILVYQGLGISLSATNTSDKSLRDTDLWFHDGMNGKMEEPPVVDGSYFPQLIIRRPDGSTIRTSRLASAHPKGLMEPGANVQWLKPSQHRSWNLLAGIALDASTEPEIIFTHPGRYEITALFHTTDGIDDSNTITVTVAEPTNEANARALAAIQRLPLEGVQLMYVPWREMTLRDVPEDFLVVFQTVLAERPDSVYATYAELVLLQNRTSSILFEYGSLAPEARGRSSSAIFEELSQLRERSTTLRSRQSTPELEILWARLTQKIDDTERFLRALPMSDG